MLETVGEICFVDNIMEAERKRSKGGGFFHLFDWNGKSRKKLFTNNSEFPEGSKQEKENVKNTANLLLQVMEVDERRANLSNKGSSDFSCSSSVTSDDGYGARAPGVVARLMGLDSLPTPNVAPTTSAHFSDHLPKVSQYDRSIPSLWREDNPIAHLNVPNNRENFLCSPLELRTHKLHNRHIDRFQTEILPPKSAKSISVTHHKLLSPIRNPGFIPKKNAAYIIEAAAKIIEASPKAASYSKGPSIGSSSVPLRIRDLKQKMEAAHTASRPQKSNEHSTSKNTRGKHIEKSQSGSEGTTSIRSPLFSSKGTSNSLKNKGKSVPVAVQATTTVQRKEGPSLRSINITEQKDQIRVKSNQSHTNHSVAKKTVQQRNSERNSNVLRPNNQKQNVVSNRGGSTLKNSVSNDQGRKVLSTRSSVGPSRTVNKVVVKPKIMSRKMDSEEEKTKGISLNKRSVNGDLLGDGGVSPDVPSDKNEVSVKGIVALDGCMNTTIDNKKNGMDIVSFTFMSPIKKAMYSPPPSGQMLEKLDAHAIDDCGNNDHAYIKSATPCFPGLNVIGGDALGVLLEQKLRELTNKMESSHCNMIRDETSTSSTSRLQNTVSSLKPCLTAGSVELDRTAQIVLNKNNSNDQHGINFHSVADLQLARNPSSQQSEEMEEHSTSSYDSESGKEVEHRNPSPVSILEPSFSYSSFSNTNDSKVFDGTSTNEPSEVEELSDSASSISTVDVVRKHIIVSSTTTESKELGDWELHYVRDTLYNAEFLLQDFVLGRTTNVITPQLFDQLENQENVNERSVEDYSKLRRKVLFDCVSERLDFMCGQVFVGSCKSWTKLGTLFLRKGWLAEELCKEILGWRSMGDLMVDELVDKDMSTQYGKWLDFSIEAFEEGIEIEKGILTNLVDELVSDLLM